MMPKSGAKLQLFGGYAKHSPVFLVCVLDICRMQFMLVLCEFLAHGHFRPPEHHFQQMQPGDEMAFSLITHPEKGPIVRNIVEGTVAGKRIRFTDYAKCRSWLSSGLPVSRGAFVLNSVVELQKYTTSCFYHAASRSYIDKTRVLCPENLARDYEFYLARVEAIYANEIDFQLLVGWNE